MKWRLRWRLFRWVPVVMLHISVDRSGTTTMSQANVLPEMKVKAPGASLAPRASRHVLSTCHVRI